MLLLAAFRGVRMATVTLPPAPAKRLPACVPFLPQDNESAAADADAVEVVRLLNDRLSALLRCDTTDFWAHVAHDDSIGRFLDTYLQFVRKPHDVVFADPTSQNSQSLDEVALAKRVFSAFRRIADLAETSAQAVEVRRLVTMKQILVTPAVLLDLVTLFGPDNGDATRRLVSDLVSIADAGGGDKTDKENDSVGQKFAAAGERIAQNLHQTADRVVTLVIDDGGDTGGFKNNALRYFHDVAVSLSELAQISPTLAVRIKGGVNEGKPKPNLQGGSKRKGKAPVVDNDNDDALGFVNRDESKPESIASTPDALCDALRRAARETCVALMGDGLSSSSSSSQSSSPDFARAANAVRVALEGAVVALENADGDTRNETRHDETQRNASYGRQENLSVPQMPVETKTLISSAREIFGTEYGDGFLAQALGFFANDLTKLAQHLFEGALPDELATVDAKQTWAEHWNLKNPSLSGSSKPTLHSNADSFRANASSFVSAQNTAWRGTKDLGRVDNSENFSSQVHTTPSSSSSFGREYQKNGDTKYMTRHQRSEFGLSSGYDASVAKSGILNLAYEDEYDDSFDELNELAGVGDGGDLDESARNVGFGKGSIWSTPSSSVGGSQRGEVGGGSRNGEKKQYWIENGRVYHTPKPGAVVVTACSVEEASAIARRDLEINAAQVYGLGVGGNRANFDMTAAPFAPVVRGRGGRGRGGGMNGRGGGSGSAGGASFSAGGGGSSGGGDASDSSFVNPSNPTSNLRVPDPRRAPAGSNANAAPNRRGAGAPPGTRAHKNENKASVGNHNRKQQAQKKANKGFGPGGGGE